MSKNYYQILGLTKNASLDEIKKSHRSLVRKYHPDSACETANEKMFHEIQEAWETLSNSESRKDYDQQFTANDWEEKKIDPFEDSSRVFEKQKIKASIFNDIDNKMKNWKKPEFSKSKKKATDLSNFTKEKNNSFFGDTLGKVKKMTESALAANSIDPNILGETIKKAKGAIAKAAITLKIDTIESIQGTQRQVELMVEEKSFSTEISIPPGVNDGEKIAFQLKEETLFAKIELTPIRYVKRKGLDILLQVPITICEALTGVDVKIPNLNNNTKLNIKIPAGHKLGKRLKIKEKGIRKGEITGDLFIEPYLVMPDYQDTEEFTSACKAIQKLYKKNIREKLNEL